MREFELLEQIFAANDRLRSRFGTLVAIPPGDDMAALRLRGRDLLVAVDQVIAGRHFVAGTPWRLVGRKAVTRNLSDVAAMAARPLACVAAAALPPGMAEAEIRELYESLRLCAEEHRCPLVGGDTGTLPGSADPAVISVTVLADLPEGVRRPIARDGARAGDRLYVTGALGGSFGADGLGKHLTFTPRVDEAIELARALGERLHAMIDLSDGLARDARHLAERSAVRLTIDVERVPCSAGCSWRQALGDGEDYELCFAAAGPVPAELRGVPVTAVGEFVAADVTSGGRVEVRERGRIVDVAELGWEHRLDERP